VVWLNRNDGGRINEVVLRRARLANEPGALQNGGQTTLVCNQPRVLSLISSAGREINTSQSAAHSICGCMCGWQVKL